jgi:hypothetical protein
MKVIKTKPKPNIIKGICELVGCTELEYQHLLQKSCFEYASRISTDTLDHEILQCSPSFATWFFNQFLIIDKAILDIGEVPDTDDNLRIYKNISVRKISLFEYWIQQHDAAKMKVYPSKAIRQAAEDEYIKSKVKERVTV